MRKAISTIVVACAFMVGAVGIADAAKTSVSNTKCGHTYTPACHKAKRKPKPKPTPKPQPKPKPHPKPKPKPQPQLYSKPHIGNNTPSPECVDVGTSYKLPTITLTATAGLKNIKVLLGPRTIKSFSFKGKGPMKYLIKNLPVPTVDLLPGAHQVSVSVTDAKKKTVHKTLHFSVCQTKPEFTG